MFCIINITCLRKNIKHKKTLLSQGFSQFQDMVMGKNTYFPHIDIFRQLVG